MTQKKIVFYEDDHRHANFRLLLKYDMLQQQKFFKAVMDMYLERDPLLLECLYNKTKITSRNEKIIKQDEREKKDIEDLFGLNENDIEDIFDIIAKEDEEI